MTLKRVGSLKNKKHKHCLQCGRVLVGLKDNTEHECSFCGQKHFVDIYGTRILYIVMFALFLVCTMYFGVISLCAGTDTMIFGIGITVIFFIFLFCFLYGLTRKCERYKGKVVYSYFLTKREYKLSDIAFSNEKTEEFYKDYGDGNVSSSWDKVTIFYNKQGEKLFKFGLAYDNVQLLVRDVKNTQRSISNQKKKK